MSKLLTVGVGDIHGRFHRVHQWLDDLEQRFSRPIDAVLAVGDVEAFRGNGAAGRKATKQDLPAELDAFRDGGRVWRHPLWFIGGNNEDFEALHLMPQGGPVLPGIRYLGRVGCFELGPLRIGFLSGIFAPRHIDTPLLAPTSPKTRQCAGYYRQAEVQAAQRLRDIDLMLLHEWPRRAVPRQGPAIRARRFPWIGSPVARHLLSQVRPAWSFCGHSHVPYATTLGWGDGSSTRLAGLDQAARADGSVLWIEWDGRTPVRAGWGTSGEVAWRAGEDWAEPLTPDVAE